MTGLYYTAEGMEDGSGLELMITVANSGMDFGAAAADLGGAVESSGGRVMCGDAEFAFYDCYIDTAEFGTLYASASDRAVAPADVTAVADAIAALHP
ncbi:hypothetical protein G7085_10325 [Tessaracoccus sp. HDW20]|uniref:hypothetical protein n=1 Tax=Tessaracoccus coleopterorum TaxID=2714950 RepID=UPI0018D4C385|nr:hypothetical protein [Tessaracoccus coleopterorum]NHB84864.1 hypothetical protein [Tessaracoccus coleopterorum]